MLEHKILASIVKIKKMKFIGKSSGFLYNEKYKN